MQIKFVVFAVMTLTVVIFPELPVNAQTAPGNSTAKAASNPEKALALQLIAASTGVERSVVLNGFPAADRNILAKEILDAGNRRVDEVPSTEIERIARIGLQFAELANNNREIARAWLAVGGAAKGDDARLAAYKSALDAAKKGAENELAVTILVNIGRLQMGTKLEEIEWYVSAIEFAEKCPDKKVLSGLLGRVGNAYAQNGEFELARRYHAKSLEIKTAMGDRLGIATTISNLGVVFGMLGDFSSALQNFKQSYELLQSIPENESPNVIQRKIRDLRNLGIVYQGMGDNAQALAYYSTSLQLSERAKYEDGEYGALFQLASLYNGQGDYELARRSLLRADHVSSLEQLNPELLGLLADSYLGEGAYQKALDTRLKQLEDAEKRAGKDDLARLLTHIGDIYLSMEDSKDADIYFERANAIAGEIRSNIPILWSLSGMARSKLGGGDFKAALNRAEQAREQFKVLRGVQESWAIYVDIGNAYSGLGNRGLALANYEKAVNIVDNLQSTDSSTEQLARQGTSLSSSIPAQMMVKSLAADDPIRALLFAERSKARLLLDAIGRGKIDIEVAMSVEERKAERTLKNQLVALNAQIESEKNANIRTLNRLDYLEENRADKRREFTVFRDGLYRKHPGLKIQRGEMKSIALDETVSLMPDTRTAIAEYVVAEDKTFLFVIFNGPAGKPLLKVTPIDIKAKDLAKRVEYYRSELASGDLDFQSASRELYDLLLRPAQAQLAGKTNIIIVPDGPLWNLPFQALMDENGKYLIEKSAVSYAPSLTALREMSKKAKTRKPSPDAELLAFGNPMVGKSTAERVQRVFMSEKLEPIPEAERLVNSLARMYGPGRSKVFTGADAREETAKTESPKYRIVQFATHGILNNSSPMYSHLVLAQNEKNPNEDGLLEAWEMKDLDLKADMVILSACDTARGRISSGEGVIGMTWAMFIAGTPTTVASQWKVESSSTTELMLEFHRQLLSGKGISKSEALRRASLKLMKMPRYKHPSYWAGFVMIGDGS